ncbi:microsomal signal peptidase 25 kDa subunit [Sodiomyces alkalinus F11]|uniref:Signal peptidase complex subunit 2 n=1 Tax=Sodiomyces alkalinus (strain CBS 110278 / VKM F-3762 / F11) TaxID=1314773 RepID=A0A3N2PM50_SODAK|nr:microsomal signal peptidase 25 kDa subunit [Sodiomyces alkalinus F11]ROT35593.1 microsomal signal peptidase 25 kDa subunit [Sodiomyces alkalinus F11]
MSSQERITVYNQADLKHTSDDAIANYLNSLRFTQSHTLTDVRLGLGYSAFLIAAACFAWDYKFGFFATKPYTAAAVVLYTLLQGALTLWVWLVEKGVVYEGISPDGEKISITTSTTKNVPVYNLTITITPKSGPPVTLNISRPFNQWFDSQGHFVAVPFQEMFASNVSAIGKLDAKRVKTPSASMAPAAGGYSTEMLDAVLDASTASATGSVDSAEATAKKPKRRKA